MTLHLSVSSAGAEDRSGLLIVTAAVMMAVAIVAVLLRLLSRRLTRMPLFWDDWFILAALVFGIAQPAIVIFAARNSGYGRHTILGPNTIPQIHQYLQEQYVFEICYLMTIALVRASLISLYHRVFPARASSRIFQYTLRGAMALNAAWAIVWILVAANTCSPPSGFWNFETNPNCLNEHTVFVASAAQNLVLDALVLAIPAFLVHALNLNLSQKVAVICTFCVGLVATIAGILRLNSIVHDTNEDLHSDPTWVLVDAGIWSYVETSLGVACACLPSFRPLVRLLGGRLASEFASYRSNISNKSFTLTCMSCDIKIERHRTEKTTESGCFSFQSSPRESSRTKKSWWSSQNSTKLDKSTTRTVIDAAETSPTASRRPPSVESVHPARPVLVPSETDASTVQEEDWLPRNWDLEMQSICGSCEHQMSNLPSPISPALIRPERPLSPSQSVPMVHMRMVNIPDPYGWDRFVPEPAVLPGASSSTPRKFETARAQALLSSMTGTQCALSASSPIFSRQSSEISQQGVTTISALEPSTTHMTHPASSSNTLAMTSTPPT